MTRRPARCTEADLKRILKAVLTCGGTATITVPAFGAILIDVKPANTNAQKRRIAL